MNSRKLAAVAFALTLFIVGQAQTAEAQLGERFEEKWLVYKDCPIPYEVVVLSVNHSVGDLFIVVEEKHFVEKDLTSLFRCLSKKYPEFTLFWITAFSDRENLRVAIRSHFNPPDPDVFTGTSDCANLRKANRPCPYGYYGAEYFRDNKREFYDYSKDHPSIAGMTRVYLKGGK